MDIRFLVALGFVVISVAYGYPPPSQQQSRPSKAAYKGYGDTLQSRPDFQYDARVANIKEIAQTYDKPKKKPVHGVLSEGKHAYAVTEANEEKLHTAKHTTLTSENNHQKYQTHIEPEGKKRYRTENRKTTEHYVSTTKPLIKNEKYVSPHQTGPQTFTSVTEESRYEFHNEPGKEREIYIFGPTHTEIPYPNSDLVPPRKISGYDTRLPDVEVKLYSTPLSPSTDVIHDSKPYPKTTAHGSPTLFYPTQSPSSPESSSAVPSYLSPNEHEEGYNYAKPTPKNIPYFTTVTPPQIVQQISEARLESKTYYPNPPHDSTYVTTHKPEPSYTSSPNLHSTTNSVYYTSPKEKPQPYLSTHNVEHEIQLPHPKTSYQPQNEFKSHTPERPSPNIYYSRESHSTESSKILYNTQKLNPESYNHPSTTPNVSPHNRHSKFYETPHPYNPSTTSSIEQKQLYHPSDGSRESVRPSYVEHQTESTLYSASLSPNSHSAPVPTYVEHESHHVPENLPRGHNVQHSSSHTSSEYTAISTPSHETLHQGSHAEPPRNLFSSSYEGPAQDKPNVQYNSNIGQYSAHSHSFTSPSFSTTESPYPSSHVEPPRSDSHLSSYEEQRVTPSLSGSAQPKLTYSTTSRTELHPSSFIEPPHSDSYSRLDQPVSPHNTHIQIEHQTESVLSHTDPPQYYPHSNNGHNVHISNSATEYVKSSYNPPSHSTVYSTPQPSTNVKHHKESSYTSPLYSSNSHSVQNLEHHTEPSYFTPSIPQSSPYPQTQNEHQKELSYLSPTYRTTTKNPQFEIEHHKEPSYPSRSYSTTPQSVPYPAAQAEHHKKHSYPSPSHNTTPQSTHYHTDIAEHHKETSYPSRSYSTTPQSVPYPAAQAEHHKKHSYPSPSYSTTPQSTHYHTDLAEHHKETSYPSRSYSTTPQSVPYPAAQAEHHKKHSYPSPSYSTTPQSTHYHTDLAEHHKETSYPSRSYSTTPKSAIYSVAHVEHHNKNKYLSPSYSTTPQSAPYPASLAEQHKDISYSSPLYSTTPKSSPYPQSKVEHHEELSYPSPSYGTIPQSDSYSASHVEHHNENAYPSSSYSTTAQKAPYPAALAENHKESTYPSVLYSTTPRSSPYLQYKVEHHKEPTYPSPLQTTIPQKPSNPAAHIERYNENSYPSSTHSTPSHSASYPSDHVEHHKEQPYHAPYSTTPQSTHYSEAHVEHHKEQLYHAPYSTTPQSTHYSEAHVEHHKEQLYHAPYSTTPQSTHYSEAHVEHHKEQPYHAPYSTTPQSTHYSEAHVEHHKEPFYASPSFITTPKNVPTIDYIEHQTKPTHIHPTHITSTPTVLVTSLPKITHSYTKHPPVIKNTTPAFSVLTNSISPESDHEVATNRIHSKITTHPVAVTDQPRHLYQPSPGSDVSKESSYLIRPWYFVFDH